MIDKLHIGEETVVTRQMQTPFGPFSVMATREGVVYAGWDNVSKEAIWESPQPDVSDELAETMLSRAIEELQEYFDGKRAAFTVPVRVLGTPFQQSVWSALNRIPYGETRSYRDIAVDIESPKAVRAVGQANRANRVAVIIPCHRVIGKSGQLVGYAGSAVDLKADLLELERRSGLSGRGQIADLFGQ